MGVLGFYDRSCWHRMGYKKVPLLHQLADLIRYAGVREGTGLRETGRSVSASRERHRTSNALVVIQVGLALVLLVSAGLMIRTFQALIHVQPGFTAPAEVDRKSTRLNSSHT